MQKLARLVVLVQNPEHEPIKEKDAEVEGRSDLEGDYQKIPYNKQLSRYILENITPGMFQIRIKGPSEFKTEICDLKLKSGDNYINVMLGKSEMRSFRMAGMNYYFEPHPEELVLSVQGAKDVSQVVNILKKGNINYEILPNDNKKIIPDALLIKILIRKDEEPEETRKRLNIIIKKSFSKLKTLLAAPIYKKNQISSGITNEIVICFKSKLTKQEIEEFTNKFNLNVIRILPYIKNGVLTKLEGAPKYEILDTIKEINNSEMVKYAQPNLFQLIRSTAYTPSDFLYPELNHLVVIGCPGAWYQLSTLPGGIRGGNPDITIAILDEDGVDPSHPDLNGLLSDGTEKITANWDFVNNQKQNPNKIPGHHGTQSAGSATAMMDNNRIGISGVAPNCHLIGGRIAAVSRTDLADILVWSAGFPYPPNPKSPAQLAKGADIISCSWDLANPNSENDILSDVFNFLTTEGRNGKGCILCFAIGNDGYTLVDNVNPLSADERTIAVGSSINSNPTLQCSSHHADPNGNHNVEPVAETRSYYSMYGMTIDIVSPSHTCYEAGTGRKIDPILGCSRTGFGDWPAIDDVDTINTQELRGTGGERTISVQNGRGFKRREYALLNWPGNNPIETKEIQDVDRRNCLITVSKDIENRYCTGTAVISGPNDYINDFGGTSHSCPTVAGAAALILSVLPDLTWEEVRDILRNTADKIDLNQIHPDGAWQDLDGDGINEYSQWYGYGRLNINEAIAEAIRRRP
ncbi:MAG: S8 family serine peptidase [Candidatus Hermodarchaeota archaeon]